MTHRYLPMTESDKKAMLEAIGVSSIDELFSDIPEKLPVLKANTKSGKLSMKQP